jgi:hypothetical protein
MPDTYEEIKVSGEQLLQKVNELVRQGNIRRITVSHKDGREILSFPLTLGVLGAAISPTLAAVGAVAALVTECTITVEKKEE